MAGMGNEKAAFSMESGIITGPQASPPEANKSQKTVILYSLPIEVARMKGLSAGAKILFAIMDYEAGEDGFCRTGVPKLAASLAAGEGKIRWQLKKLEFLGLIKAKKDRTCNRYKLKRKYTSGRSMTLPAEIVERKGVRQTYKLVLCLMLCRQNSNGWTRDLIKEIADYLGCTKTTIRQVLMSMKEKGEVEVRRIGPDRGKDNKYILTPGAVQRDISRGNHNV